MTRSQAVRIENDRERVRERENEDEKVGRKQKQLVSNESADRHEQTTRSTVNVNVKPNLSIWLSIERDHFFAKQFEEDELTMAMMSKNANNRANVLNAAGDIE